MTISESDVNDFLKHYEKSYNSFNFSFDLLKLKIDHLMIDINNFQEKEDKCQKSIFYRNFYKKVKEAEIKPLHRIINSYGAFYKPDKPENKGNIVTYLIELNSHMFNIYLLILKMESFKENLEKIHKQHKEIYDKRMKSLFYRFVYDI